MKSFDGSDMTGAVLLTAFVILFVLVALLPDRGFHNEATLPATCNQGQRVLVTTPVPVEYYVCEAHWVRR